MSPYLPDNVFKELEVLSKTPATMIEEKVYFQLHYFISKAFSDFPRINFWYNGQEKRYYISWPKYNPILQKDQLIILNIVIEAFINNMTSSDLTYKDENFNTISIDLDRNKELFEVYLSVFSSPRESENRRAKLKIESPGHLKNWVDNLVKEIFAECV